MLMVIFGAGASYDSLPRQRPPPPEERDSDPLRNVRPPLANHLFEERWGQHIKQFGAMKSIISDLEQSNNVEAILEDFKSDQETYPRRKIQLMAVRHYLQTMLSSCQNQWEQYTQGATCYTALIYRIDRLVEGKKLIVSFNFDTLLEDALTDAVGLKLEKWRIISAVTMTSSSLTVQLIGHTRLTHHLST